MDICIYSIRNNLNGKIYIGSTKNFKSRKYSHFWQLRTHTHGNGYLQAAFIKYGEAAFSMDIIECCNKDNRQERELFHIREHLAFLPDRGYNMYRPNGDRFTCAEETKDKLREVNITIKRSIPIDVYSTDLVFVESFDSINECADKYKFNPSIIRDIIHGKNNRLTYKGLTFFKRGEPPYKKVSSKQRNMHEKWRGFKSSPFEVVLSNEYKQQT